MLVPTGWLPSRRLALGLLVSLLVLPFIFTSLRQRLYSHSVYDAGHIPDSFPYDNVDSVISLSHTTFEHTDFYHVPSDPAKINYCGNVEASHIQQVARLARPINLSVPVAYHFQDGSIITDSNNGFPVGTGFCSVMLVPQVPWDKSSGYKPSPIEGMGPDSITAEMASPDVRVIFTDSTIYWGNITVDDALGPSIELAVYAASYVLNHPGAYQMSAIVELGNYQWTMEEPINLVFKTPIELQEAKELSFSMTNYTLAPKSPPIIATGEPLSRPTQPCYRDGFDQMAGRWYRANAFAAWGNQTALNPRARLEAAEHNTTVDEFGWTFAPDACELTYFTGQDHLSCMADRTVQLLGDSNIRRFGKSLIGGGEQWCLTNATDELCQCHDADEQELLDAAGNEFNISRFADVYGMKGVPATWGYNSSLYFDFVGGLNNPHWGNEWHLYYNGSYDADAALLDGSELSIVTQRQREHGPIDLVYISMVVWDLAGVATPAETLAAMSDFRQILFASYPDTTRLVVRLANAVCCGAYARRMRFSAPRFQMWNTLWREFWAKDFEAGRIMFIDASALQDRADVAEAIPCGLPHLPCGHVRLEQMMFMNAVCEKAPDGTMRMRDWADRAHLPRPFHAP